MNATPQYTDIVRMIRYTMIQNTITINIESTTLIQDFKHHTLTNENKIR